MSEATATPEVDETPTFVDEMHELSYKQLSKFINERNSLVGQANAAHGDRVTLTEQITEESTDPEIVAAREARDEAIMLLHSLVTPKVNEIVANAEGSVAEVEARIKEIDATLKPGLSYYKNLYGEDAAKHLPTQVRTRGMSLGKGGGGGRRVRGFKVDVTVDGETTGFDNFAGAAKYLAQDTTLLQDAFFKAAGDPKQVKDAPDEVSFTVTFNEVDEDGNESENSAEIYAYRPAATDGDDSAEGSED